MFEIEERIEGWRRTLLANEGMRVEDVDELEDHLRQEIAGMQGSKLTEQEIFLVATHRLGNVGAIVAEFERGDPRSAWRRRWIWMLSGYLGISVALRADLIAARLAELAPSSRGWGDLLFPTVFLLGLAAMVAFAWWTGRGDGARNSSARRGGLLRVQRFIVVWAVLSGLVMSFAPLLGGMMQATSWIPDGMAVVSSRSVFLYLLQLFFWLLPTVALAILLWRDRRRDASVEARLARAD